jgi:hypothetical protein
MLTNHSTGCGDTPAAPLTSGVFVTAERFKGKIDFLMSPIYDLDSDYFVYEMPEDDSYHS